MEAVKASDVLPVQFALPDRGESGHELVQIIPADSSDAFLGIANGVADSATVEIDGFTA